MEKSPPIVLTIAGFDPTSGAGVTADIKTIAAHGCYGVACITALTVQSTRGVRKIQAISGEFLAASLAELTADMAFSAVHVGMLASAEAASAVADFLALHHPRNVVVDPVLRSTSGAELLDAAGVRVLIDRIMPVADVLTPNIDEASILTGQSVESREQMNLAAEILHNMRSRAVVVTGGHLSQSADLLSSTDALGKHHVFFESTHLESNSTHGTGCAFATAVACNLALGKSLSESVSLAQKYVWTAIAHAYPLGRGKGPLNHYKPG